MAHSRALTVQLMRSTPKRANSKYWSTCSDVKLPSSLTPYKSNGFSTLNRRPHRRLFLCLKLLHHLKGGTSVASYEHLYDKTVLYNGENTSVVDLTAAELTELGPTTLNSADRAIILETARAQAVVAAHPKFEDIANIM
jgi:hypothetical protein